MTSEEIDKSVHHGSSTLLVASIPTVLLIVIALVQFTTAHTTVLTPWKGGGFGMFSTVDVDTARIVTLHLKVEGTEYPVEMPRDFSSDVESLRPMPTAARTERLARRLAARQWVEADGHLAPSLIPIAHTTEPKSDRHWVLKQPLHDDERIAEIEGVRLQVWAPRFIVDDETGGGQLYRDEIQNVFVATSAED